MSDDGKSSAKGSGGGCLGCIGLLAAFYFIWALIFGITWDGVHHAIQCSSERGVEFVHDPADGAMP